MLTAAADQSNRGRDIWRSCLASAFRPALACTIVGCVTLYGPELLRRQLEFPAFSYVTVILIVNDATLGDTIRNSWHSFCVTVQGVGPAILTLWAIGPARFSYCTTALVVALSAFVVALPESTHLVSKRIALGQIVLVYVAAFSNRAKTEAVMRPVHVAACTAVGILACVLALVFPYPRLACYEVKQNCKQFAGTASGRLKLFVKAFCAGNQAAAFASVSQAKSLAVTGKKLLQSIKRMQESMQWERLPIKIFRPHCRNPGDKLQDVEMLLRGMEIALTSSSFPVGAQNQELKDALLRLEEHDGLTLKQLNGCLLCNSPTVPESDAENVKDFLQTLQTILPTLKNLPSLFFLFCFELLHWSSMAAPSTSTQVNSVQKSEGSTGSNKQREFVSKWDWSSWIMKVRSKKLMPAFKCSLALGLAVLFGLIYSRENGYWSGLPLAIGLASAREATFKIANVKAQGTVLGSVYGILGCFLFEKFVQVRFLSLLPWFIFTSFLQRSRMYGQAGGISAVVGAILILGRKNFGPPSEFAIARITETFIGLSCSIMVEILLQPTRASTLSKIQLSRSLGTLHECIGSINLFTSKTQLGEIQKKLRMQVNKLEKFIGEAKVEPNFWFLPFHSACYCKLLGSLSKMADLLRFGASAIGFLEQESARIGAVWKEVEHELDGDLELFRKVVGSSIQCFEEVTLIKSLVVLEKELEKKNIAYDLELGKSPSICGVSDSDENDETEKIITSYLLHSRELVDKIHDVEGGKELKSKMNLSLGALGFCLCSLITEIRAIEKGIKELVQWENPSSHINLYEISCKLRALHT